MLREVTDAAHVAGGRPGRGGRYLTHPTPKKGGGNRTVIANDGGSPTQGRKLEVGACGRGSSGQSRRRRRPGPGSSTRVMLPITGE